MSTLMDLYPECRPSARKKLTYKRAYDLQYALLSNRVISLFDWRGLPFPQRELEIHTQLTDNGYTGAVWAEKLGRWIVAHGSGVGVTEYPDVWKTYTWACPLASGNDGVINNIKGISQIGKTVAILRNNSLLIPSRFMVQQYAHLMAHTLLSLQAALINSRATGYSTAKDDQTAKRIKNFYDALEDGRTEVILTEDSLEAALGSKAIEFISDKLTGAAAPVLDYWQLYQNLYKDFLCTFGISKSDDKRERLITDEVMQDVPLYRFNIEDMLDCRKQFAEDFSKISKIKVTVDLAESVKQSLKEDKKEVSADESDKNESV